MHVIHEFLEDFYNAPIRVLVLGFIRPEQNYPSLGKSLISREKSTVILISTNISIDALITDIKTDVEVARRSLARKNYLEAKEHKLFL